LQSLEKDSTIRLVNIPMITLKTSSAGGKARAKKLSPQRRREIAKLGGEARALSLSARQRKKAAAKAARARWGEKAA